MNESTSQQLRGLVHSGLLDAAARTPEKVALQFDAESITFKELVARANTVAVQLVPHFDSSGERRVGLCVPNSPAVVHVFFGTVMAGGCVCLFDPGWPKALIIELLQDLKPDVLVAPGPLLADIENAVESTATLSVGDLETSSLAVGESQTPEQAPHPDTPFLIGFTSGSSGKPKAFVRSHQTWVESFRHSAVELGTNADECVLAPGPLSHGLSLYAVIESLCSGATAIIQSRFNAHDVMSAMTQQAVSSLVVVPTMLDSILAEATSQTFPGLKRIITAGAKLSPSLRAQSSRVFPNAEIIEYYGASELSFITVAKGSESGPADSVGRAFSGVDIDIRDETGRSLSAGQVGTVWVKSEMICSGYVGITDGSGLRQDNDWATVGDLGHLDRNGYLYLVGREGSAITSAGYTVYPSAIENALLAHAGVSDAAVIGLPHERWGEVIAAAVVPKPGQQLTKSELEEHCTALLEPYACPRAWRITDALERTQSGKVNRSALAALFAASES